MWAFLDRILLSGHYGIFFFNVNLFLFKEFKYAFNLVDADGKGSVNSSEIGSLLRATGMNPSLKKIEDILEWLETNGILLFDNILIRGSVGLSEFLYFVC
jgi:Ca2+-binding EF-hand superfamily protein